jgi:hypothetical protein
VPGPPANAASAGRFKKLTDLDLYRKLQAAGTFATPVVPHPQLTLNSEVLSSSAMVDQIMWLRSIAG